MVLADEPDGTASDDVQGAPASIEVPPAPAHPIDEIPPPPTASEAPPALADPIAEVPPHPAASEVPPAPADPIDEVVPATADPIDAFPPPRADPIGEGETDGEVPPPPADPIGEISFDPASAIVPYDNLIQLNEILMPAGSSSRSKWGRKRKPSQFLKSPYEKKKKK